MTKITVLSAPGCHSCTVAKKMLEKISKKVPFEIEEIDVSGRPDMLEKYGFLAMPGIAIDGKLEFSGLPSEKALEERIIKLKNESLNGWQAGRGFSKWKN